MSGEFEHIPSESKFASDPTRAIIDANAPINAAFIIDWTSSSTPNDSTLLIENARPSPIKMPESIIDALTIATATSRFMALSTIISEPLQS
jgi:hypothetical protein